MENENFPAACCGGCGERLSPHEKKWESDLLWGEAFCSEYCLERTAEAVLYDMSEKGIEE